MIIPATKEEVEKAKAEFLETQKIVIKKHLAYLQNEIATKEMQDLFDDFREKIGV